MSSYRQETLIFRRLVVTLVPTTLIIYLLRGLRLLTFIPGGIIYLLILLSLISIILYGIDKTRRF
jgi:hypothetical protein